MKTVKRLTSEDLAWLRWFYRITKHISFTQRAYLKNRNFIDERSERLQGYVDQKIIASEVAKIEGLSRERIRQLYKKYGISPYKKEKKDYTVQKVYGMSINRMNKSGIHTQQLINWYNEGYSPYDISKMLNKKLSANAIYNRLRKAGIEFRRRQDHKILKDEEIVKLRLEGWSYNKIGKLYGVTGNAVLHRMNKIIRRQSYEIEG